MKGIRPDYAKWASANLPNQYQPFVAIAYDMMKRHGMPATSETVLQRLKDSGRDRETIIERHRRYGSSKRTPQQNQ